MIRELYTLGMTGVKCQTFDEKHIHSYAISYEDVKSVMSFT